MAKTSSSSPSSAASGSSKGEATAEPKQPPKKTPKKTNEAQPRRTGQIVPRGKSKWLVRIFLGRNDQTGKRDYFNQTIHGTKKDAQAFLTAKLREIDLGVFVEPAADSLNSYLDRWLKNAARPRLRAHTCDSYEDTLRLYVREPLGARRLMNVRPLDIQEVYTAMLARGLSARVVRYTHAVLNSAFTQAVQWGMLTRNPCQALQLPKQQRAEMRALSLPEATAFLEAVSGTRHQVLFTLALTTGMRPSEVLALQWSDMDWKTGRVSVNRTLVRRRGGGWAFDETKTARSRRIIPLPATLLRQLEDHRQRQREYRTELGSEYENNELIFASETGTPLDARLLAQRHFKPALRKAGLPENIRLYDLRHTCATLLLLAGENPKIVSERLGHASITLTLDTYSHVLPDMQQAAADKLEKLLFDGQP